MKMRIIIILGNAAWRVNSASGEPVGRSRYQTGARGLLIPGEFDDTLRECVFDTTPFRKGGLLVHAVKKEPHGRRGVPRFQITEPLSFSDQIAFDQFILAVERNFLLHVTAGLNLTVVGLAMFRFFSTHPNDLYAGIGIGAFCVAILIIVKGSADFVLMRKDMRVMEDTIHRHRETTREFKESG